VKIMRTKVWMVDEKFGDLFEVTRVNKVAEFRSSEVKSRGHGVVSEEFIDISQKFGGGQKRG
jgi:hypothetical protein